MPAGIAGLRIALIIYFAGILEWQTLGFEGEKIPSLAKISRVDGKDGMKSISGCCHILLFYGLGGTDLPHFSSGNDALRALTDDERAISIFGKSPFVVTRNGLRYFLSEDPIFHSDVGESHQDQCLATFAGLGLPLNTPIRVKSRQFHIKDLLTESLANFSFDQKELAWSAIAFAKYLPPQKEWVSRFGERKSFTKLTSYLIRRDLNLESCAGTHILQALVHIDNADRESPLLEPNTRQELQTYLASNVVQLLRHQREDGSWEKQWSDVINDSIEAKRAFELRLVVTGHVLEVLGVIDRSYRPAPVVYQKAAGWLKQALNSPQIKSDGSWVCPFTHAARGARQIAAPAAAAAYGSSTFSTARSSGVDINKNK